MKRLGLDYFLQPKQSNVFDQIFIFLMDSLHYNLEIMLDLFKWFLKFNGQKLKFPWQVIWSGPMIHTFPPQTIDTIRFYLSLLTIFQQLAGLSLQRSWCWFIPSRWSLSCDMSSSRRRTYSWFTDKGGELSTGTSDGISTSNRSFHLAPEALCTGDMITF